MAKAKPKRNKQKAHGGGSFKSENQRKWMWENAPRVAKRWSHNKKTRPSDWVGVPGYGRGGYVPFGDKKQQRSSKKK